MISFWSEGQKEFKLHTFTIKDLSTPKIEIKIVALSLTPNQYKNNVLPPGKVKHAILVQYRYHDTSIFKDFLFSRTLKVSKIKFDASTIFSSKITRYEVKQTMLPQTHSETNLFHEGQKEDKTSSESVKLHVKA